MGKGWPAVRLGEVVAYRKEFVRIDDMQQYKRCRVQLHAKGVVLRDIVPGVEIKTKSQQVCRAGEFLVAEIDAKVGGFGIVPEELDGAIVSSHYFLFAVNAERLDRRFLDFFARTPAFRDQVNAQGSTNYAAVRPAQVLAYQIPLPPLSEQRRIVAKIDRLAEKIKEARGLREKSESDLDAVLAAACRARLSADSWKLITLEELVGRKTLRNGKSLKATDSHSKVRCLRLSAMSGAVIDTDDAKPIPMTPVEATPYLLRANAAYVMRGNGSKNLVGRAAIAERDAADTIFPDLLISIPLEGTGLLPQFFVTYRNSPDMRRRIQDAAKTTSGIWKINQGHVASFSVPIPPTSEQRHIVAYLDDLQAKVDATKKIQKETAAELDALLPSILDKAFRGEL